MEVSKILSNLVGTYKHYLKTLYLYSSNDEIESAHHFLKDNYAELYLFFSEIKKTLAVQCQINLENINTMDFLVKISKLNEVQTAQIYSELCDTVDRYGEEGVRFHLTSIFTNQDPESSQ